MAQALWVWGWGVDTATQDCSALSLFALRSLLLKTPKSSHWRMWWGTRDCSREAPQRGAQERAIDHRGSLQTGSKTHRLWGSAVEWECSRDGCLPFLVSLLTDLQFCPARVLLESGGKKHPFSYHQGTWALLPPLAQNHCSCALPIWALVSIPVTGES